MKLVAFLFFIFVVSIIVQADRGRLPDFLGRYREIPYGDTLGHFFLIGILALLVNCSIPTGEVHLLGQVFLKGSLVIFCVVFLEELSQLGFVTRTFSLTDLVADGCGIYVSDRLVRSWRRKPKI